LEIIFSDFFSLLALSLNGYQLEGTARPLMVKYAEDQHKKKELNRLHNLTLNTAFPRGMGGGGGSGQNSPPMGQNSYNSHQNNNNRNNGGDNGNNGGGHPHHMNHQNNNNNNGGNNNRGGGGGGFRNNGPPPGMGGMGGMGGGGMGGMNHHDPMGGMGGGMMGNPHHQMKPPPQLQPQQHHPHHQPDLVNPAFYYQTPQSLANMYNNPQPSPGPVPMLHSPMNAGAPHPHQMFIPNAPGSPIDFNKRQGGQKGGPRKGFGGFESPTMGPTPAVGGPPPLGNWFPQHTLPPFMNHNGLPPPPALHPNPVSGVDLNGFPPSPHLHGMPLSVLPSPQGGGPGQNNLMSTGRTPRNQFSNGAGGPPSFSNNPPPQINTGNNNGSGNGAASNNPVTVSVSNLPANADVNMLYDLFSNFGKIMNAQIDDSPTGRVSNGANPRQSRGRFQMNNLMQAETAVKALNGANVFEGSMPLQVTIY
jgi:hypothetical protein